MAVTKGKKSPQYFPALRCAMGDWVYYMTYMKFSDIERWIKKTEEVHTNKHLSDMIQRSIGGRTKEIAEYLTSQEERFFNAVVVGLYNSEPEWYPMDIEPYEEQGIEIPENLDQSMGLLKLSGKELLFAIDGQHRIEAIKRVVDDGELLDEELGMIFVAHGTDEQGQRRTRRLFSTLNRYAVPVSKGDIIALSEDDAFAITVRNLVERYEPFSKESKAAKGFVAYTTSQLSENDTASVTTILTLYNVASTLYVGFTVKSRGKQIDQLLHKRPANEILDDILNLQTLFWNGLRENITALDEVLSSSPTEDKARIYRNSEGGHVLFRPVFQQAFAQATRTLMDRKIGIGEAISILSTIPMDLGSAPWKGFLWNPVAKKMNNKVTVNLIESIILYYSGQEVRFSKHVGDKLVNEYRKVLGMEDAMLPVIK